MERRKPQRTEADRERQPEGSSEAVWRAAAGEVRTAYSLDPENKRRYIARKNAWEQEKAVEKHSHPDIIESDLGAFKEKLRKDAS